MLVLKYHYNESRPNEVKLIDGRFNHNHDILMLLLLGETLCISWHSSSCSINLVLGDFLRISDFSTKYTHLLGMKTRNEAIRTK